MRGFTFLFEGKTVFVETERERKTRSLARNILNRLEKPDAPCAIDLVLRRVEKAECELKTLENGADWYSIKGKNFSEFGPIEDLQIIHVI